MYQNLKEVERPYKQKKIIIESNITPITRKITILSGPAMLVGFFAMIFIKGLNKYSFSLDHIFAFLPIAGPFAFFISYKFWKALGTKVILTDQKITKKAPSGKELHLNWSEIKKISIIKNLDTNCIHLVFSRKKRMVPFDNTNRILCPPGTFFSKTYLPEDAASLILNKIDLYKIPVRGTRGFLEEIVNNSSKSLKGQARPAIPNMAVRKQFPAKPSSSQTPTPK